MHLIQQFRIFMQMMPPGGDFSLHFGKTVFDGQSATPLN
jgi:hypothetical protein